MINYDHCRYKVTRNQILNQHEGAYYFCGQCSYEAKKKDYLKWHVDPYHEGGCFICDQCSYMATRKGELKQHVESHHDGVYYNYNKCNYKSKINVQVKPYVESLHEGVHYNCDQIYTLNNMYNLSMKVLIIAVTNVATKPQQKDKLNNI